MKRFCYLLRGNDSKSISFFPGDSLHIPPVERSYKAKTLVHYPENVSWNPFDEHAVCMVSLSCAIDETELLVFPVVFLVT